MLPSYWKCHGVALSDRQIRRSDYTPLMHWLLPVVAAAASTTFGAVLNVPWLALGTVELLARPALRRAYVAGLAAFTVLSVVLVALARVTPADLAGRLLPEGKEFLPVAVRVLAVLGNVAGTVIVVGGAVASGLALRSRRNLRPRFEGNLLIALGVLLAASGGVFAFLASSDKLALGLALGASVMYLGFRRASVPVRPPVPSGQ